jgi:hypothetical protein
MMARYAPEGGGGGGLGGLGGGGFGGRGGSMEQFTASRRGDDCTFSGIFGAVRLIRPLP